MQTLDNCSILDIHLTKSGDVWLCDECDVSGLSLFLSYMNCNDSSRIRLRYFYAIDDISSDTELIIENSPEFIYVLANAPDIRVDLTAIVSVFWSHDYIPCAFYVNVT